MSSDSMFKYFIACLALCSLVYADGKWVHPTRDESRSISEKCRTEHPLKEEQLAIIKTQIYFPDEPEVRQYLLCYYQMHGIFSTLEGFHPDRLAVWTNKGLSEEEALQIAQGCVDSNEQKSSSDEWAYRGHKCLMSSKIGDRHRAFHKAPPAEAAAKA